LTSIGGASTDNGDRWAGLSRFVVVTDKILSSAFLGYVSLEYEFELSGMRPATRAIAAGTVAQTNLVANNSQYIAPVFKTIKGVYDILQDAVGLYEQWNTNPYPKPSKARSITAGSGKYAANAYLPIGPVISSTASSWTKISGTPSGDIQWVNPNFRIPGMGYEGEEHKSEEDARAKISSINAVGDVGVSLIGQDLTDLSKPSELIAYQGSNSSGGFNFRFNTPVQFDRPYRIALLVGQPDNRILSEGSFDLASL
jgi:hypothetical protein